MRTIWYWSGVYCNQDRISTQKTANLNELNLNDFLIFFFPKFIYKKSDLVGASK